MEAKNFGCGICQDVWFKHQWETRRHLEEHHSGVSFKCRMCCKMFSRQNIPHQCKASLEDMIEFDRATGKRGQEARRVLEEYREKVVPRQIIDRREREKRARSISPALQKKRAKTERETATVCVSRDDSLGRFSEIEDIDVQVCEPEEEGKIAEGRIAVLDLLAKEFGDREEEVQEKCGKIEDIRERTVEERKSKQEKFEAEKRRRAEENRSLVEKKRVEREHREKKQEETRFLREEAERESRAVEKQLEYERRQRLKTEREEMDRLKEEEQELMKRCASTSSFVGVWDGEVGPDGDCDRQNRVSAEVEEEKKEEEESCDNGVESSDSGVDDSGKMDLTTASTGEEEPREQNEVVDCLVDKIFKDMGERIILNVGGTVFSTCKSTLCMSEGLLAEIVRSERCKGEVFIDRNPELFIYVLDYLRNGGKVVEACLPARMNELVKLCVECDFYQVKELRDMVLGRMDKLRDFSMY